MPARKSKSSTKSKGNGATLGFEQQLWEMADRMRGYMDPAEYKHVALGLIFLKYISDAFQAAHDKVAADPHADPEDRDEYTADNVFWVPREARWPEIQASARQPDIGNIIDAAMLAIEKENTRLKGVLPREYGRPGLNKERLGELIDLISKVDLIAQGDSEAPASCESPADATHRSLDLLGRIYEYFLAKFAGAEGKSGGEFYTPRSVVRLLVEMIEPYQGRIYDPCCGSGGMFVQSEEFIRAHGRRIGNVSIFGQESNHTTWRLAKMNLAIRGIEANLGPENADTFSRDLHPDLKADYILANPPFNMSFWGGDKLAADVRWKYGAPPTGNANYAWIQHIIHHLAPAGIAGFVLANGSMSSNTTGQGEIRRRIVEADLVNCMIALPSQLFYGTGISACLWFVARDKATGGGKYRNRRGETLFIDARKLGYLEDRTHRDLPIRDITNIADTYHSWRGDAGAAPYSDVPGYCASAKLSQIGASRFALSPGSYVGAEDLDDDDEPFESKMRRLTTRLTEQFSESVRLQAEIQRSLGSVGYGG